MDSLKLLKGMYIAGILLIVGGSLGHFSELVWAKYVFGVGAILVILERLIAQNTTPGADFKSQRIARMQLVISLLLGLGAYSMFDGTTLWVATVAIYAFVTLFLSFRR